MRIDIPMTDCMIGLTDEANSPLKPSANKDTIFRDVTWEGCRGHLKG